ncbi:MAG TPA: universal stress protein [Acidobacteriota bacterium]|nr:universal stress protein [Acidobacteriota bacterium]
MKKILVALDFSPASRKALRLAVKIARPVGADVLAVYVLDTTYLRFALKRGIQGQLKDTPDLKQRIDAYLEKQLGDARKKAGQSYSRLQTAVVRGIPSVAILKAASEWKADLIVAGTTGRSLAVQFLIGSTAGELIRSARCPVLTLNPKTRV